MQNQNLLIISIGLLFSSTFFSVSANAACTPKSTTPVKVCMNEACNKLGLTTMDGDQQNIIACLKNSSGNSVWKSTSGGGTVKGLKLYSTVYSVPKNNKSYPIPGSHIHCSILYPGGYSWGGAARLASAGINSFGSELYYWMGLNDGNNGVWVGCLDQQ